MAAQHQPLAIAAHDALRILQLYSGQAGAFLVEEILATRTVNR